MLDYHDSEKLYTVVSMAAVLKDKNIYIFYKINYQLIQMKDIQFPNKKLINFLISFTEHSYKD